MVMKRGRREEEEEADKNMKSMANCLMLLSNGRDGPFDSVVDSSVARVFECKTCNRQFPSFQALGGHRASHKKPRLIGSGELRTSPAKPKTHECPVCGMEFAIGQALGGHMRRHRAAAVNDNEQQPPPPPALSLSPPHPHPIVKRSNSRRVFCLDLNLTPSENKFLLFGKVVPTIESCI